MTPTELARVCWTHDLWVRGGGGERLEQVFYRPRPGSFPRGVSLQAADMSHSELPGVNLRGFDLRGCLLRWVNLSGANLRGANLRGADLSWADLRGADLGGSDLGWANLSWANLRGSNLSWANLRGADLRWADLRWADLRGSNLRRCRFYYTKGVTDEYAHLSARGGGGTLPAGIGGGGDRGWVALGAPEAEAGAGPDGVAGG